MKKYKLVLKSGYEQIVQTDEDIMSIWKHYINGFKGIKLFETGGMIIDLSEVAIVKRNCEREFHPFSPSLREATIHRGESVIR